MILIKTVFFSSLKDMDTAVNEFLSTIGDDSFKDIKVEDEKGFAVILYEAQEEWKDRMCSECKYWDDAGQSDSVSGLCHECGGRRRFNCRACDRFKDIRD